MRENMSNHIDNKPRRAFAVNTHFSVEMSLALRFSHSILLLLLMFASFSNRQGNNNLKHQGYQLYRFTRTEFTNTCGSAGGGHFFSKICG